MRIISCLLITISLLLSCQQSNDERILGVWHYVDKNPPKPTITEVTEVYENGETKVVDLDEKYPTLDELHFFLTFAGDSLTQNKFGLKLTTKFRLEQDTIVLNDDPFFKIVMLNDKILIVERLDSGTRTKYDRVEPGSPLLKLAE